MLKHPYPNTDWISRFHFPQGDGGSSGVYECSKVFDNFKNRDSGEMVISLPNALKQHA